MRPFLKGVAVLAALSLLTGCLGGGSGSDSGADSTSGSSGGGASIPTVESGAVSAYEGRVFLEPYSPHYPIAELSVSISGVELGQALAQVADIPSTAKTLITYVKAENTNYLEGFRVNGLMKVYAEPVMGGSQSVDIQSILDSSEKGRFIWLPTHTIDVEEETNFNSGSVYDVFIMAVTQDFVTVDNDLENWNGYLQAPEFNDNFFTAVGSGSAPLFSDAAMSQAYKDYAASMFADGHTYFDFDISDLTFTVSGSSELFTTTNSLTLTDSEGANYPLAISVPVGDIPDGEYRVAFDSSELFGKDLSLTYHPESGIPQEVGRLKIPSSITSFSYTSNSVVDYGDYIVVTPSFTAGFSSIDILSLYYEGGISFEAFGSGGFEASFDLFDSAWIPDLKAWVIPKKTLLQHVGFDDSSVDWESGSLTNIVLLITPVNRVRMNYMWDKPI